ncbi:sensor histidine kinase [Paenibacillus physcomitrellae]|uniref:histidine kinase n=1 Tax=Paenibacillus physcomitrellae TaxID=1619311 RepID=A0ABQ1FU62_9BACL|nr:HAMP domain-containing sensor histidine kinase [Paenibacillus physcomitrellae]GGA29629.1 histidine kinase [Paenibacillus physcomitrellae]
MFNRLRNRFLLMNMVIISFIMLVAFATIYTITYQNVRRDIDNQLHQVADTARIDRGMGPKNGEAGGGGGPSGPLPPGKGDNDNFRVRSVFFELRTDSQWNITDTNSRYDMDEDFYQSVVQIASAHPKDSGRFTLSGTRWAYGVFKSPTGYDLIFMEVSSQQKILTNLIYTFSAVAVVMLIVIYFVSRYFAGRSIAPVKEAFDRQKLFIADASHELKTPLAVINTNADVLLANREDTIENQVKWVQHIKSETERMKTLTNDLLYLTEMDEARARAIQVPFDLSEALESLILTMEPVIFEKNLSLDYRLEPGLTVTGSSEQMKQVAMILLDNAVKYAGSKGSIEVQLGRQKGHILLAVSNTGPGIPPEHLDKIFDRFYRVDASRSRQKGGYGLGLAIAKSIVEQHRGKIYARSTPNETTTFYVQLNG